MKTLPIEMTENGIHYTLHGDYYFPNLALPETVKKPIGHYGRMRLDYLREHRPGLYTRLILSSKLYEHLTEINKTSRDRLDRMIPQMARTEGVNEALKAHDPMTWVARMNSIRHRAEESILTELIYG
ncbi:MAG: TnpV protein [Lachnospiraceae bacterium]|nr:TnpV protein [Lachnospiraceae bacterium]